jgi:serine/threonine-protein kinase
MPLLRLSGWIACLPLALVLASCAGGSAPSSATAGAKAGNPGSPGAIAAAGVVPASFTFVIPLPSSHAATRSRKPQYLPATALSLEVQLVTVNGSAPTPVPSPTIANVGSGVSGCTATTGAYTCTVTIGLPVGIDAVLVKSFDAASAGGNVLSQQNGMFTVVSGSANSFTMTLDASPGAIAVTPPNGTTCSGSPLVCTVSGTSALAFTLTVADAHGTLLANNSIAGSPVVSVVSSNTAIATVTATQASYGIGLTPVAAGTASIAVTASPATGTSGLSATTLTFTVNVVALAQVTTFAGSTTSGSLNGIGTNASFSNPQGVATDGAGNVYVADTRNNAVRMVTSAGVVTTLATGFNNPGGVAVDTGGNVYVADYSNNVIKKVTPGGVVTTFATGFSQPNGVAVDTLGNVYVADEGHNKISEISPAGVVSTLAGSGTSGSTNGTGISASFSLPTGVAVDGNGNVYVADYANSDIRKVSAGGVVTTLAGSGTRGSTNGTGPGASFNAPFGVAVDASGNVYVADSGNNKIREITADGVVTTLAGSGTRGSTNGTGATFSSPTSVAVGASGAIYVADQNNNEIRKIVP